MCIRDSHLAQFGVVEMPRSGFCQILAAALDRSAAFPAELSQPELEAFLQSTTQTS